MRVYIGRSRVDRSHGPVPCKPALVRQWRVMGTSLKGYQRGVDQIISKEPQGAATIRAATRKFTAVTVAVGNPVGPVLINLAATLESAVKADSTQRPLRQTLDPTEAS